MIIENKKYPANHVYDFIIVGAGLSGLLIANKFLKKIKMFYFLMVPTLGAE
jgi:cation diffusion facilitator CzcD-associated flavoprotein CzcO